MAHDLTDEQYNSQVSAVWKATLWLSIITIVEVAVALVWYYKLGSDHKLFLNGFLIIASLLKAFFIVGEFMHLNYEKRALTLSILVPMVLFIWGIIAFLIEGDSIKNLRGLFN
ncbi:MAG: cytochrome C oxidase subunit IV family protein [Saprospiraceae bacterium]|nr:cytochrome C oxidase subunit IV family protein [Saprospiraceae bacterium]